MVQQKLQYLLRSILNFNQTKQCPNCTGRQLTIVDTKFFFTRLYRCDTCKLNFRFPVDTKEFLEKFYQSEYKADYSEVTLEITHLPSDEELEKMMSNNFYGKRNYSPFVKALTKSTTAKVLDYGCSWGYSLFQLKTAGYDAEGFEISKVRALFGKKLGVAINHNQNEVRNNNDLIMSSHAIEHLPVIQEFVDFAASKLSKNGILMSFCPNGSPEYRNREPEVFHVNWGLLHPNYLTVEFAIHTFQKNPYLILTDDWRYNLALLEEWDGRSQIVGKKLDGQELLIIAKPNVVIH
jgi:2-polyprenyl-3-methyl-5-hydroxy-6-metoxy-1,4-benzoquinol methylase